MSTREGGGGKKEERRESERETRDMAGFAFSHAALSRRFSAFRPSNLLSRRVEDDVDIVASKS